MYYVYVLRSSRNGKIYIGMTEKDPRDRLQEHNDGSNRWTTQNRPFELRYYESYYCKMDARHRELFLKTGIGRQIVCLINKHFSTQFPPKADQPLAEASAQRSGR